MIVNFLSYKALLKFFIFLLWLCPVSRVQCLFSNIKYTRDHHTHLGLPVGRDDDDGCKTINQKTVKHHSSVSLSSAMAYWSVFQILSFLDFIKVPQNAFGCLFFFPLAVFLISTLVRNKVWNSTTYSLHLFPETMWILLILYMERTRNKINTDICLKTMWNVWQVM